MARHFSPFRSLEAEMSYRRAYDEAMSRWPVAYRSLTVETRFGDTHVIRCGPETGDPVLLLHGLYASSTQWSPNIEALSRSHRVYAVDTLGDVGKSVAKSAPRNKMQHSEWLLEVMEGIAIDRAHLIGISYGALLAVNFALHVSSRVDRLVLMSPAILIAPFTWRWIVTGARVVFFPSRSTILKVLGALSIRGFDGDDAMLRQRVLGMRGKRARPIMFPAFSPRRLRGLSTPSLILFGDAEIMYDPRRALAAATRLMPRSRAMIIRNGGHSLNWDQPEIINRMILEFLDSCPPRDGS